jgi:tyrosine phenol-lyase
VHELPEPWRVKSVEPIRLVPPEEREQRLLEAGYNLFNVPAEAIFIDLLTDSGTSAMSDAQWAGIMTGDESYAGARSFFRFETTIREIFGFPHVIPTHQGRMGENLLFSTILEPGDIVTNNTHFDTTRANVESNGGIGIDLVVAEGLRPDVEAPFKGNIDLEALDRTLAANPGRVKVGMITLTNNSAGGQPASLANVRATAEIYRRHGVPFWIDACRFAENAWFIKQREAGQGGRTVAEIVRDVFECADGCIMSAKKDGLANIGGFVALRSRELFERLKNRLVIIEGFPTYGGLAGRDLEAVARGLREVLDEAYLAFRVEQVRRFGQDLIDAGIPLVLPVGGHAVYVDARALLPHIPPLQYPGQSLTVELYREGAVRAVEIGSLMFARTDPETGEETPAPVELVRLAVPRRVYTNSHLQYVAEVLRAIRDRKGDLRGYRIVRQARFLRHFTAELAPL